jgi:hypothetical protein
MGTRTGDTAGVGAGFAAECNWQVNDGIRDSRIGAGVKQTLNAERPNAQRPTPERPEGRIVA